MTAIGVGQLERRVRGTGGVALGVLRGSEGEGREGVVGDGRWGWRLAIGIVVRANDAVGGIEVGEPALIGAVEGCWALLDNEPLLRWLEGSRLGGRLFGGVGIGTSDRTVGLYTTSAVDQTTLSPHTVFLLTNIGDRLVGLLCGCGRRVRERQMGRGEIRTYVWGVEGGVAGGWKRRNAWGGSALSSPCTRRCRSESRVP